MGGGDTRYVQFVRHVVVETVTRQWGGNEETKASFNETVEGPHRDVRGVIIFVRAINVVAPSRRSSRTNNSLV